MINSFLYQQIIEVMPVPCVDIIVTDKNNNLLLIKRKNEPSKGLWWFPGGRVMFGETRMDAAIRIIKQECGFTGKEFSEMGTYDLLLPIKKLDKISHAITTLFHLRIPSLLKLEINLDDQSSDFQVGSFKNWLDKDIHEFIRMALENHKNSIINKENE